MKNRLFACFIPLLLAFLLNGCGSATNAGMLRNRAYDYTNQPVVNLPNPPQTPSNLTPPQFAPTLTLPVGQNSYPPEGMPNMTPPDFNQKVPVPVLPPKSKSMQSNS